MKNEQASWDPLLMLRSVACFMVVWAHILLTFKLGSWFVVRGVDLSFLTYPNPFVAVFIFFLLSGYGIGCTFVNGTYTGSFKSLASFYLNRIVRIVPLYYFCVYIAIAFFYRTVVVPPNVIWRFFTFTATDSTTLPVLFPFAIISTEMQFYLIAPILFFLLKYLTKKLSPPFVGVMILLIGIAIRFVLMHFGRVDTWIAWNSTVYTTVIGSIDIFVFGLFISILVKRYKTVISTKGIIVMRIYVFLALICLYVWSGNLYYRGQIYLWGQDIKYTMLFLLPAVTSLFVGTGVFLVGVRQRRMVSLHSPFQVVKHSISPKYTLESVGVLSYGIYLWHWPLADTLRYYFGPQAGMPGMLLRFGGVIFLSVILSMLSYSFIEYPFLLLKSQVKQLFDK